MYFHHEENNEKIILRRFFWDSCVLSSWKISGLLFQPIMFFLFFLNDIFLFHIIGKKAFFLQNIYAFTPAQNIARDTMDPEYWLHIFSKSKIVHEWFQWHYLNWIGCKFGHQMAPLALIFGLSVAVGWVSSIVTGPWNALLALSVSVSIEFVSSSARITSVKFQKGQSVTTGPLDRIRETMFR